MTGPERNGYRRTIATALAVISMTVLLYAAVLVLAYNQPLNHDRAVVLAVFLGLHTFALTILTGDSPWPHLTRLISRPPDHHDGDHTPGA